MQIQKDEEELNKSVRDRAGSIDGTMNRKEEIASIEAESIELKKQMEAMTTEIKQSEESIKKLGEELKIISESGVNGIIAGENFDDDDDLEIDHERDDIVLQEECVPPPLLYIFLWKGY